MPSNTDSSTPQYTQEQVEELSAVAGRVAQRLFHRVLLEGPKADEFYIVRPDGELKLHLWGRTPHTIQGKWYGANYVPDKRRYVPPARNELDRPIPHTISDRAPWHIHLSPQSAVGIWGVRVENPRLTPMYHAFVCASGPAEAAAFDERQEAWQAKFGQRADRYTQRWHRFDHEDDLVAAAINAIKGKL